MLDLRIRRFRDLRAAAVALALLAACGARAQDAAEPVSRIRAVQLYPGSATVERALAVRPGATQAQFACLPAGLEAGQLQARGSDGVQVGEISVRQQPRNLLGSLCRSALDEQIEDLQEQRAAQDAEIDAIDYATGFLKSFEQADKRGADLSPEHITAAAQALQQSGLQWLRQRRDLQRAGEQLDQELQRLLAERERSGGPDAPVSVVRVTLYAPMGGEVALRYPVRGPGWQPEYRAELDTGAGRLLLTRLARVAQATGEDWTEVPLTLSTGQPAAATAGPLPRPWRIGLVDPEVRAGTMARSKAVTLQAEMASPSPAAMADAAVPRFDAAVFENVFATEFQLPQPVTVPTGGDSVTLVLGEQELPAQWLLRTAPALDPQAYLVAQPSKPLTGVWPAGPVALYRDGALVGRGQFAPDKVAQQGLAFGRDERVRVRTEQPERRRGTSGLIGNRNQRVDERRYTVENGHDEAVQIQVLDAAPVAEDDKVKIQSEYQPAVQPDFWQEQRGTVFWQQELGAGASAEFAATHTISWPRDEQLRER